MWDHVDEVLNVLEDYKLESKRLYFLEPIDAIFFVIERHSHAHSRSTMTVATASVIVSECCIALVPHHRLIIVIAICLTTAQIAATIVLSKLLGFQAVCRDCGAWLTSDSLVVVAILTNSIARVSGALTTTTAAFSLAMVIMAVVVKTTHHHATLTTAATIVLLIAGVLISISTIIHSSHKLIKKILLKSQLISDYHRALFGY